MHSSKLGTRISKIKSQFLLLCLVMTTMVVFANPDPPAPQATAKSANDCLTCPDPLPINENAIIVLGFGLIFGSYMIYRYNTKQKNLV